MKSYFLVLIVVLFYSFGTCEQSSKDGPPSTNVQETPQMRTTRARMLLRTVLLVHLVRFFFLIINRGFGQCNCISRLSWRLLASGTRMEQFLSKLLKESEPNWWRRSLLKKIHSWENNILRRRAHYWIRQKYTLKANQIFECFHYENKDELESSGL